MKVVVQGWEGEQPIYNTRFLAFAFHYGYRPWACRPHRPQTKAYASHCTSLFGCERNRRSRFHR
jgi:transposase